MKYALSALVLATVGAGAALAQAAQLAPPSASGPTYVASFQAPSNTCRLQLFEPRLVVLANPSEADSWSLSIETPDFINQQSGPVMGLENRLKPVSRLMMGGIGVQSTQGATIYGGSPRMPRPFRAELNVFDLDGELVCRDLIDLP
jgi:hypothetical protein